MCSGFMTQHTNMKTISQPLSQLAVRTTRARYSKYVVEVLETAFGQSQFLSDHDKDRLCTETKLPLAKIRVIYFTVDYFFNFHLTAVLLSSHKHVCTILRPVVNQHK